MNRNNMNRTLFVSAALCSALLLASCGKTTNEVETATSKTSTAKVENASTAALKVGVVSLDSLYAHYKLYTDSNEKLEAQMKRNEQALASKAQKAQKAYTDYMERGQKGLFTSQAQVDEAEKNISNLQQEGARLEQQLTEQMIKAQTDMQKALHDEVSKQLELYTKEHGYDLILTSTGLTGVMYCGETMDITQEVLDYLNKAYEARQKDGGKKANTK